MSEPITNAADAVRELGALPVPVGPEPQKPRPIAYAAKNTDLLMADAAERSRAAEWPWDMWCRICHIRPTSHRTEAEALEAADRHVKLQHAPQAEVHKLMAAGGLSELERLKARVAELEAEREQLRQLPSLPLDKLAKALLLMETGPALAWAHAMSDHDLHGFLDDLVSAAMGRWQSDPEVPDRTVLANVEKVCATWRTPGQGNRLDGSEFDGVTVRIAPSQVPCEVPDGEHAAIVHHNYRVGRDLPETGGAR